MTQKYTLGLTKALAPQEASQAAQKIATALKQDAAKMERVLLKGGQVGTVSNVDKAKQIIDAFQQAGVSITSDPPLPVPVNVEPDLFDDETALPEVNTVQPTGSRPAWLDINNWNIKKWFKNKLIRYGVLTLLVLTVIAGIMDNLGGDNSSNSTSTTSTTNTTPQTQERTDDLEVPQLNRLQGITAFTVEGWVYCNDDAVFFVADTGEQYQVNGVAKDRRWPDSTPILRENETGGKVSVDSQVISDALAGCGVGEYRYSPPLPSNPNELVSPLLALSSCHELIKEQFSNPQDIMLPNSVKTDGHPMLYYRDIWFAPRLTASHNGTESFWACQLDVFNEVAEVRQVE